MSKYYYEEEHYETNKSGIIQMLIGFALLIAGIVMAAVIKKKYPKTADAKKKKTRTMMIILAVGFVISGTVIILFKLLMKRKSGTQSAGRIGVDMDVEPGSEETVMVDGQPVQAARATVTIKKPIPGGLAGKILSAIGKKPKPVIVKNVPVKKPGPKISSLLFPPLGIARGISKIMPKGKWFEVIPGTVESIRVRWEIADHYDASGYVLPQEDILELLRIAEAGSGDAAFETEQTWDDDVSNRQRWETVFEKPRSGYQSVKPLNYEAADLYRKWLGWKGLSPKINFSNIAKDMMNKVSGGLTDKYLFGIGKKKAAKKSTTEKFASGSANILKGVVMILIVIVIAVILWKKFMPAAKKAAKGAATGGLGLAFEQEQKQRGLRY